MEFFRIVDNMPITWCYEVADSEKKYCSTGFPIGCTVTDAGQAKDACVISVSFFSFTASWLLSKRFEINTVLLRLNARGVY